MMRPAACLTAAAILVAVPGTASALGLRTVGRGFGSALGVVQAPGELRLLVVERNGVVRPILPSGLPGAAWLDIRDRVGAEGVEQGLLGLAFAPDFATSHRLYVDYTDRRGDTRVVEFRAAPGAKRVSPRTASQVLFQRQPFANHNGGALQFGPDGMLYIALGDGGGRGDPSGNGANPMSLLGKILRIDPSHRSGDRAYGIPPGNPYADGQGGRPEVWARGLRNPWRISFDRATGDLWIGDVGQSSREEIDVARASRAGLDFRTGLDFGWNRREGTRDFTGGARTPTETDPVAQYTHGDDNCSVTGGYVYRGRAIPALTGRYVYADWCSGRSWTLNAARPGRPTEITRRIGAIVGVTSFGQDRAGEIYVVTDHTVRRFTP
ncbi:MAG: hypothetical protein EXQ74_01465 [Thermoleophilia bacterium]|nr:hypothetical protein [Thermoleophilia bacterium]